MRAAWPIFLILLPFGAICQQAFLFVKKGGRKKAIFVQGDPIRLVTTDGFRMDGRIKLLEGDTIYLTEDRQLSTGQVGRVLKNVRDKSWVPDTYTLLLITGGAALTTAGLTLSDQASFKQAALAGVVIGYGPLLIRYIWNKMTWLIRRKYYPIGNRYRLQLLDLRPPV
ncbi:hypothetical protein GCM10027051_04970 [Niabella terrae]